MTTRLLTGDCRAILPTLPAESVHCVVTSPPYWGLRDYGTATWEGGDPGCDHRYDRTVDMRASTLDGGKASQPNGSVYRDCPKCGAILIDAQLGLEPDFNAYVANMVAVFREVRRVLRDDGTLWLNLGDSYASGDRSTFRSGVSENKGQNVQNDMPRPKTPLGLKPKDLCGIPWRVAFALQADGWYLRQDIIWSKPNPMPESVTDRCTKAHEYLFLLSKRPTYYYDADAIAEPVSPNTNPRISQDLANQIGTHRANGGAKTNGPLKAVVKGSTRKLAQVGSGIKANESFYNAVSLLTEKRNKRSVWEVTTQPFSEAHFATFPPALIEPCIKAGCPIGGTVLDPFAGAGTTGLVADRLQRNAILIELNPAYAAMSSNRIKDDAPLFAEVAQP